MVKVYGTTAGSAPERENVNVSRQLMAAIGIMGVALLVCVALVASSSLQNEETVMYGLGSGEEQEADNSIVTTFETFKDQKEMVEELLGEKHYEVEFKKLEEETEKHVKEVKDVIKEAENEHKILKIFAEGADAPLK